MMRRLAIACVLVILGASACHSSKPTIATPAPSTSAAPIIGSSTSSKLPISLDNGALQVSETTLGTSSSGQISATDAIADMKSAEPAYYAHLSLSDVVDPVAVFGAITLRKDLTPKEQSPFASTAGWVVLYKYGAASSCPAMGAGSKFTPKPAGASDYRVFLINATGTSAINYRGTGIGGCGGYSQQPITTSAKQMILVEWHELSRQGHTAVISYSYGCGSPAGVESGSSGFGKQQSLDIEEASPFGLSHCPGALVRMNFTLSNPDAPITHQEFGVMGSDDAHRL